ncbi:Hamartin protein-domain-containing protein [Scheffersomyces xylosifermentans]|uniref:Hamartin protein-domain-containing protein n=1 Tax=Scheffersomyces xylosifermentans TaxID=1304137 RepID=UPI00315C5498
MSGSSRSLTKGLDSLFDGWSDDSPQSTEVSELFTVIAQFLEKHNTLQIIRQSASINDELFRIYNTYIKPSSNIAREYMFLDILKQLSAVLNKEEVMLWLKTYLKPAVDSAGFDFTFVQKSREFIRKVSVDFLSTNDKDLEEAREDVGLAVMETIITVYLGDENHSYDIINLQVSDEDKDSQIFQERIRFIKSNSAALLQEYGLKRTTSYFNLINSHFIKPAERLGSLTLLSSLVSTQTSQVYSILETVLFSNLLKCLSYDFSESVVFVSLNVLVMLIPQISNRISMYLSDLLLIYIRISNWEEFDRYIPNRYELLVKFLVDKNIVWTISNFDFFNELMNIGPLISKIDFDVSHLATLIYGLFPLNFSKFCQGPFDYLHKYPPRLIELRFLQMLDANMTIEDPHTSKLEQRVIEKTKMLYQRFIVHPKFINFDNNTIKDELQSPIKWILDLHNNENIGSGEISISCLSLNPDIMVSVSDSLIIAESNQKSSGTSISNGSPFGSHAMFNYRNRSSEPNTSIPNSQHVSRNSSIGSPVYFNIKDGPSSKLIQKSLQNFNRKMSIVPTNLVIDGSKTPILQPAQSEIKFKEVKFSDNNDKVTGDDSETEKSDSGSGAASSTDLTNDIKLGEPLPDLFLTHEKLYGPKNAKYSSNSLNNLGPPFIDESGKKSSSNLLNEKLKNELRIQRPVSSPTTSLETTAVHKGSIASSAGTTIASTQSLMNGATTHNGTALDFYQRELLLMKNELEFSSYMKHLNKFQYIRLKLKMNKLLREASLHFHAVEHKNNVLRIQNLTESYDLLNESFSNIREQMYSMKSQHNSEKEKLTERLILVQEENSELKSRLDELTGENKSINGSFTTLVNEVVPEKDYEIECLKMKLKDLELNNEASREIVASPDSTDYDISHNSIQKATNGDLSEQEKKIYTLKEDILMLQEKNLRLSQDLSIAHELYESMVKNYENKISSSKLDLNENLSAFTSHYEKKIQELSTTILRFEALLEEKNSRILQLSSSKPISIPTSSNYGSRGSRGPSRVPIASPGELDHHDEKGRSNSSLESNTPPPAGHAPISVMQNPPVLNNPHFQQSQSQGIPPLNSRISSGIIPTVGSLQQPPIIRGRGGYQKRSKKHM